MLAGTPAYIVYRVLVYIGQGRIAKAGRTILYALGIRSRKDNMKTFIPPTLKQVEDYVREKNLLVDPDFFVTYYDAGDWHDKFDDPVKNWKQKLLTWHRKALERGEKRPCRVQGCKGFGVYPAGKDRDGHPYYRCINHKPPEEKASLPKDMTDSLQVVKFPVVNVNDKRNEQRKKLGL